MYYSNGNYEAFARPRKPAGVDSKTAWFVGSGLAALSGAAADAGSGDIVEIVRQTIVGAVACLG